MAWEEIDIPEVLIMARCSRCHHVAGKFDSDGQWDTERRRRGSCQCVPWPVLPSGDELAGLVARARRRPAARLSRDARLVIRV
jgi:hypothetical protein